MKAIATSAAQQAELQPWKHLAIFLLACAVFTARRPDAITHAQFFAEDGHVWIADAYNLGWWPALSHTWSSTFQLLPRLAAGLALLGPLPQAPLVLNLIAIAMLALPVSLLLSSRSSALGSFNHRALMAAIYLVLPNCSELSYGITESQWPLALSAFLLLVAHVPKSAAARIFDISIVLLSGLSGPFCYFLMPFALFLAWRHREPCRWAPAGMLTVLCLVQAWGMLIIDPAGRSHASLGASPALFARLLAGHVYLGALLGSNGLAASPQPALSIFLICAAIVGTILVACCYAKTIIEMKLFLILSAMILAASLASPICHPPAGVSIWAFMATIPGVRYWFFPTLAFAWSLLWCYRSQSALLRFVSTPLLLVMLLGIVRDWREPAFKDTHFAEETKRLQAAPAGMAITIPENPEGWTMRLIKHPANR